MSKAAIEGYAANGDAKTHKVSTFAGKHGEIHTR